MAANKIKVTGYFDVSRREGRIFDNDIDGDNNKVLPANSIVFWVGGDYQITDPEGFITDITVPDSFTLVAPVIDVKTSAGATLAAGIALATYQPGYFA